MKINNISEILKLLSFNVIKVKISMYELKFFPPAITWHEYWNVKCVSSVVCSQRCI